MGQEPKIDITAADAPRPQAGPAPARRWKAARPGDLHSPDDVPWGGGFGTPGPDTGYALKLAAGAEYELEEGESRHNVDATLAVVMSMRASSTGKAPSADDLSFALLLLGLDAREEVPDSVTSRLVAARKQWAPRAAHSNLAARQMSGLLPPELLALSPADLRHRLALGEVPLSQ
ncbi:MAG: hypothetical protein ACR2OI_08760 [Acidimicrobiia bacterium]